MNNNSILLPRISYTNLDIAKFICSLLVIIIHTSPFSEYPVAQFYSVNVIARIAVPLFFGITGFLLFGQMSYENGKLVDCAQNRTRMLKYLKKTIRLYFFWAIVYLFLLIPDWYQIGWWGWTAVKDALHAFLIKGMFVHLWYLIALIWAVPITYTILRMIPLRQLRIIAVVLWTMESMDTTYGWLWNERIELLTVISEIVPFVFTSTRRALPIMTFGASLALDKRCNKQETRVHRLLIISAIWILEASTIYFTVPNADNFSNPLIAPFFVYCALDFLITEKQVSISNHIQSVIRETNTVIYCLHPLVIHLLKKTGMGTGIVLWLLTTAITAVAAHLWAEKKQESKKK